MAQTGYSADFLVLPQSDMAVVVLGNLSFIVAEAEFAEFVVDVLNGERGRFNSEIGLGLWCS